jgi:hypothetical protein
MYVCMYVLLDLHNNPWSENPNIYLTYEQCPKNRGIHMNQGSVCSLCLLVPSRVQAETDMNHIQYVRLARLGTPSAGAAHSGEGGEEGGERRNNFQAVTAIPPNHKVICGIYGILWFVRRGLMPPRLGAKMGNTNRTRPTPETSWGSNHSQEIHSAAMDTTV